jgi:hypothetical protein
MWDAGVMKASIFVITLAALPNAVCAEDVTVTGRAGYMFEWEITASAHAMNTGQRTEFVGPLVMKHVGLCAINGPEEKSGEIRFWRTGFISSGIEARLNFNNEQCTFAANDGKTYHGIMQCPTTPGVPLWLNVK